MAPSAAFMMARKCPASSGPGSSTAISSTPNKYVLVPGPVIRPALGATIRRTPEVNCTDLPGISCDLGSTLLSLGDPRPALQSAHPIHNKYSSKLVNDVARER